MLERKLIPGLRRSEYWVTTFVSCVLLSVAACSGDSETSSIFAAIFGGDPTVLEDTTTDSGSSGSGGTDTDGTSTLSVSDAQGILDMLGNFNGDLNDGDGFGAAVAEVGDLEGDGVTDLAVGAPFDDGTGSDRGAVWILLLNGDGTVLEAGKISDLAGGFEGVLRDGDRFGTELIGDLGGNGVDDLAAGARGTDDGGVDRGAAWTLLMDSN